MPADFGATCIETGDAWQQAGGEIGVRRLHRRDVDSHPADARRIERGEHAVGCILIDIDDAAAPRQTAHGVDHVRIVAAVGAGLNEDEALEAEPPRLRQIILERRERRRVAKLLVDAAVGIAIRRPEHMEMRVTAQRRRGEERFDATIVCQNDFLNSVGPAAI